MYRLEFDESLCTTCPTSDCLVKCQYLAMDRDRARGEMIKIARGEDSPVLHDCVTCYACEEYCQRGNHPFYLISERREERGIPTSPRPTMNQFIRMFEFEDREAEGQYQAGPVKDRAISFCILHEMRDVAQGQLFDDLRSSFVAGVQFFCQVMYLHFARPSIMKERLPRVIDNIASLGVKELVCIHDECYGSFSSLAPAYGMKVPFTPIHYLEYMYEKLTDLKAHIKPVNLKVAFQRPCSSRLSPDKYRFVGKIFDLIGAELVERTYQEENSLCCGPMFRMNDPGLELCDDVQTRNVDDMVASGAEYCVFNCPACQMFLSEKVAKKGVKPIHMIELCRMALGEKQLAEGQ